MTPVTETFKRFHDERLDLKVPEEQALFVLKVFARKVEEDTRRIANVYGHNRLPRNADSERGEAYRKLLHSLGIADYT